MAGDLSTLQNLAKGIDKKGSKKKKTKPVGPKLKDWQQLKLNRDKLGRILTKAVDGNVAEQQKFQRNVQALVDSNLEYQKAEEAFKSAVFNTLVDFGTPLPVEIEESHNHGPVPKEKVPKFECSFIYLLGAIQRQIHFMQENSLPLLMGVLLSLILANSAPDDYNYYLGGGIDPPHHDTHHGPGYHGSHGSNHTTTMNSTTLHHAPADEDHHRRLSGGGKDVWTLFGGCINFFGHLPSMRFVSNDLVICFFFGIAAKEITESVLPGGSLNPPKKAAGPLIATLGGVIGPIIVYFILVPIFDAVGMFEGNHPMGTLMNGWGVVTATDIAMAWVVAKKVFGEGHPAIDFLLLLAIADDGIGLIIVAIFYGDPEHPVQPVYLLVTALGMTIAYGLRKVYYSRPIGKRIHQSWCLYVCLCGPLSWIGLIKANLHPALALCFIVPFMPGPEDAEIQAAKKKHDDDLMEGEEGASNKMGDNGTAKDGSKLRVKVSSAQSKHTY
jgi:hypothetical protein